MDAYGESLGYPIKDGAKEGSAAKWLIANGYTPDQVRACYAHLKAQPFYQSKHLSLQTLAGNIGAYMQNGSNRNGNTLRQGAGSHPERAQWTTDTTDIL